MKFSFGFGHHTFLGRRPRAARRARAWRASLFAALLALAGCQGAGELPTAAPTPDTALPAPPPGAVRYEVVPGASEIVILVFRGGSLARLGHNHVVATTALSGVLYRASPIAASTLRLDFAKDSLVVDEPARRLAAGEDFADGLPADAIAATRDNMLGPALLDAATYPRVTLLASGLGGSPPQLTVPARVTVTDTPYDVAFPVTVSESEDGRRLVARGERRIAHAALGLEPFSVMLGALRVEDEIVLRYSIIFEKRK